MAIDYIPYGGPVVTRAQAKAMGLKRYFMGPDRRVEKRPHQRTKDRGWSVHRMHPHWHDDGTGRGEAGRTKEQDDAHRNGETPPPARCMIK